MIALLLSGLAGAAEPLHPPAVGGHAVSDHPAGAHGAEHGEGEAHVGAGEHHVTYSDDDDLDGIPNWRDPLFGSVPNEESYVLPGLGFHTLNLLILLGILGFALRKPVADTFRTRALEIRNELTGAARARDEAHQRHQELVARLQRIESEVAAMEATAAIEAEREEAKLVERAHREAERIAEQAERNLRDETNRARTALRNEAVELAVRLAEATLRQQVGAEDRQALARDFLRSLKESDRV